MQPHSLPPHPELAAADLTQIQEALERREKHLAAECRDHRRGISQGFPADFEESSSLREESDLLDSEERLEAGELQSVEEALSQIKKGGFGYCKTCHKPIPRERILVLPSALHCVPCQSARESGNRR